MKLKDRIEALCFLGTEIQSNSEWLSTLITKAYNENRWFTAENSWKALNAISNQFLIKETLDAWAHKYEIRDFATVESNDGSNTDNRNQEALFSLNNESLQLDNNRPSRKVVGLVLAGNIPLVGFHDVLSTFICGHTSLIKCSSKDVVLLKTLIDRMVAKYPESESYFEFSERLKDFDAVIATGSNNSSRYFEQYFAKYPHIIRKNRSAVAILDGSESKDDILNLGEDIFCYFGLGCRNVSKLYVPENYTFDFLLEILHEGYKEIANHNKYRNNFDYNNALFLLNKVEFLMSGSLIITASKDITSRIATLHYEHYSDRTLLDKHLVEVADQIQCVVSSTPITGIDTFTFGEAQKPSISDYADGVDTVQFLKYL